MNDKEKKFYLLFLPIVAILVIGAVVYLKFYKKPAVVENTAAASSIPLPEVSEADTAEVSKIDGYSRLSERKSSEDRERKLMENKDFFGFDGEEKTEVKTERRYLNGDKPDEEKTAAIPAPAAPVKPKPVQKRAASPRPAEKPAERTAIERPAAEAKAEPVKQAAQQDEPVYYNAFSVHKSASGGNQSAKEAKELPFLEAVLEENQKLKKGTQVTFIAKQDYLLKNTQIKKGTILYGVASMTDNRIDIKINKARLPSSELVNLNLEGYNENYQKGIYYEGKGDAVAKDAANTGIRATVAAVTGGNRDASNIVRGSTRSVEADFEIFVAKGYTMYFR